MRTIQIHVVNDDARGLRLSVEEDDVRITVEKEHSIWKAYGKRGDEPASYVGSGVDMYYVLLHALRVLQFEQE